MPVTSVPDAGVQVPHPLMRNHQFAGPLANARSTEWSLFTVAVSAAVGMMNSVPAIDPWLPQLSFAKTATTCVPDR